MAKQIFLPVNGMNDKDVVIPKNTMTEIVNMEIREEGQLEKRMEQKTFSSNLNTAIATKFAETLPMVCDDPFFPARKPTVMYDDADYIIPIYGKDSDGDYLLYIFYETSSGTWGSTQIDLESSGIVYTSSSSLIIKYIRDMLMILDYAGNNEPHYVTVNEDKEIVYDLVKNSVARPDRAISFEDIDGDTNRGNIFTSQESDGFSSPKLFRWFYTIVNIFADEGNPSPGSLVYDLAYKSEDTDALQQQWVEGVLLNGMSLPVGATDKMKEEADKYRIYRQECNDASSYVFTQPQFIAEVDILNTDGETSYLDTITVGTNSPLLSFSNNRAPIARDAELVGESIMLSKLKLRIEMIANFDYISPIKITNPNSETYPNGITRIRLNYDFYAESSDLEKYPVLPYLIANKNKVRLIDSDLATPIPVVYDDSIMSKLEEDITDPGFLTACGVNWVCGAGWVIYPAVGTAIASSATGDLVEAGVLANESHLVTIIHGGATIDGNFEIDYGGGSNTTIDNSIHIGGGVYQFTCSTSASGAAQDFKICPIGTAGGKFYYASAQRKAEFNMIDIYARIPMFEAGQQRKLYLAYCAVGSPSKGIEDLTHWQGVGEYGEFQDYVEITQWALQKVFVEITRRNNSLICSPTTLINNNSRVMNKSNELNYGDLSNASWNSTAIDGHNIPMLVNGTSDPRQPNSKSIKLSTALGNIEFFNATAFAKLTMPERLTFVFRVQYDSADLTSTHSGEYDKDVIAGIAKDTNEYMVVYRDNNGVLAYRIEGGGTATTGFLLNHLVMPTSGSYFIGISLSHPLNIATFFLQDCNDANVFHSTTVNLPTVGDVLDWVGEIVTVNCGVPTALAGTFIGIDNAYYSAIQLEEKFIDGDSSVSPIGENSDDECAFVNMANYMPPQRTSIVGYKHIEGRWYGSTATITLTTTITIVGEDVVSDFENADELYINGGASDGILAETTSVTLVGSDTVIVSSTTLINQATGTNQMFTGKKHNNNIIIDNDDIEQIEYKEHKNTAMFTNANGMSFPPGNIKIADRPILRQMKTPTTLAEMRNSLIWFYRNGFTRYIADGDPLTWADATNLKIPQLAGRGLLAENSLATTDEGIVWFAEKGIQLLRGIEPETISKMFDIPIKDTYTHWYCSLTNQYALHDNEFINFTKLLNINVNKTIEIDDATTWASLGVFVGDRFALSGSANNDGYFSITAITNAVATVAETCVNESISSTVKISKDWVINLKTRETTTFRSLDMISYMSIAGGNTVDNIILTLNQYNEIDIYPDYDNGTYTTGLSRIKKIIRENYADFVSILAKYGKASGNIQIKAQIEDPVGSLSDTLAHTDLEDFRTKDLPINFIGNKLTIELRDAETLEYFIIDIQEMLQPV